jgi:O-antigen chain-terminating methyltransferase
MDRLGAASSSGADIDYSAFEDRFRGDSESLGAAQRAYLPYLPPPESAGVVLDLGCGRGEMLQVLVDSGHEAVGVDMDPSMLRACQAKGLPVVEGSALPYLRAAAPDTYKAIFCAQVVEHLLTSEIEELLRLSLGRLKPGGVLLVETINPSSLHALANHFYADTSHVRPVHPETLKFLCEQVGFSTASVEYRSRHPMMSQVDQMDSGPTGAAVTELLRSVYGFQDYMVLATK